MWPLDEASERAAQWITAVAGALIVAWKIFLRVRRDKRQDSAGVATSEGYELIIDGQQKEIIRLHASLDDAHQRARAADEEAARARRRADLAEAAAERANRRAAAAEEVAALFKAQISVLEMDIARLEQSAIDRKDNPLSPSADR